MARHPRFDNINGFGDRTSTITVGGSLSVTGTGPRSNAVDGGFALTGADSFEETSSQTAGVTLDFDFGTPVYINGFVYYMDRAQVNTWKLQASADNVSWVDITGAVASVAAGTGYGLRVANSTGTNDGFYRYYRLYLVSGTTSATPWQMEVAFRILGQGSVDDKAAQSPSYSNFLGSGFRLGLIGLGGTITWNNASTALRAFDGVDADASAFFSPNSQSGKTLEFDFATPVQITEMTWSQTTAASHGTWQWAHLENDGVTWTNVGSTFTLGGATTSVITAMSGDTGYYKKFRMSQATGVASNNPNIKEITFKIGYPAVAPDEQVDTITPNSGFTTGGTPVTIGGGGFTSATGVTIGGAAATSFVVVNDTEITCETPAGSIGAKDVVVQRPTTDLTLVGGFTYISASVPVFTSISPSSGVSFTPFVITGDNFTDVTTVEFDGVSIPFTIDDDEHISGIAPSHAAGTVTITITAPSGFDDTGEFTFLAGTRITQSPIMVIDAGSRPTRITQALVMVLYLPVQPARITQSPISVIVTDKPLPLPAPIVPEVPLVETWEWNTTLSTSNRGKEQRSALRINPRLGMSFTALIMDDTDRRLVYEMIVDFIKKKFYYPMYVYSTKLASGSASGTNKLYFDPATTDMRDGEKLALFDPHLVKTTYVDIDTIDLDGATLTENLTSDIPAYFQVCPVSEFRMKQSVGLQMNSIDGDIGLVLEGVVQREIMRPDQSTDLLTLVDGLFVLDKRPLANNDVGESFTQNTDWLDNDINTPEARSDWPIPYMSGTRSYLIHRPQGMDYWRAAANYLMGMQKAFLLPTFRNDLPLAIQPALNATKIVSSNISFYAYWRSNAYRYIQIQSTAGTIIRKILEVVLNYDEISGQPVTITIELSSSIGGSVGSNVISLVSFVNTCRLDNDVISLEHGPVDTELTIKVRAVEE